MIIFGDYLENLEKIDSNTIDCILTDPPYNISKKSGFKNGQSKKFIKMDNNFGEWDGYIDLSKLLPEYYRVLKKSGTLIMFFDVWKCQNLKDNALSSKFKQPRVCQWVKNNPTPINSKSNYLSNSIEYFFTFTKFGKPTFNSKYDNGIYNYPICHGHERLDHPTQKPIDLIKELILKHSNVGDLILDTFSGTGTTAAACIETNRKFISIENNEYFFNLQKERLLKYDKLNSLIDI